MDPVRAALVARLSATPAVTSLLGQPNGIWHRVAPNGAIPPFIVMHRQAETDYWTMGGAPTERDLWMVKAVCRGNASTQADDLAAAVTVALNDAPISVAGYALLQLRRVSKIDLGETADGEVWHSVGGVYRVDIDPV